MSDDTLELARYAADRLDLGSPEVAWMLKAGVRLDTLHKLLIGQCDIERSGRFWQPAEPGDGVQAIILPCFDDMLLADGLVLDLVAVVPSVPTRLHVLTGTADVLGGQEIDHAAARERPVRVVRSALEYLTHGGQAMVILDDAAAWWRLRSAEHGITCCDEFLAGQVERWLAPPTRLPEVYIDGAGDGAA